MILIEQSLPLSKVKIGNCYGLINNIGPLYKFLPPSRLYIIDKPTSVGGPIYNCYKQPKIDCKNTPGLVQFLR